MREDGHCVLITGASRGIGQALARRFYRAGNQVVLVGRDSTALRAAAQELPGALVHVANITDVNDRNELVRKFPQVSVLVNNAGVQFNGEFTKLSAQDIETEVQTNLLAPLHLTHAYLPVLSAHSEAAIVNVSSVLALMPKESASVYCATKAAIHSFSVSLRWQLEKSSIRVFEIVPPLVDTAMTAGRGAGKISAAALAEAFWVDYLRDDYESRIGKAKIAGALARWLPLVAQRILRR